MPTAPTYQHHAAFTINPFHRPAFQSEAYVFRLRGADNPADFYRAKTRDLRAVLAQHIASGTPLRGLGSSWSLSDVGVTAGRLVTTENWTQVFGLQGPGAIDTNYAGSAKDKRGLLLIEAGISMTDLDEYLLQRKLSVKAHGSNNGQSFVGAMSTNTHGAAFGFGSIHDSVVGIHLVAGPTESVYLERASYPVLAAPWVQASLEARVVRDDDLFNAVLVSFGSMGVIRGVVVETRPLFTLEARRFTHKFNGPLKDAMTDYDFSRVRTRIEGKVELVPDWLDDRELYHFEVTFNPNDPLNADTATARTYVNLMLADSDLRGWVDPPVDPADLTPHATEMMAHILTALGPAGVLLRDALNQEVDRFFVEGQIRAPIRYMFRGQVPQPSAFASGIGLPADRSPEAFEIALNRYAALGQTLPVLISGRFVKGTAATLGFTRFPDTCVLELDGIRDVGVEEFFDQVLDELDAAGIPFALHWGKVARWYSEPGRMAKSFGPAAANWKTCREQLLPTPELRALFSNALLVGTGLQ